MEAKGVPEMPFERSLEIERRLDDVLRLIRTGRYSTPMLAEEVGVSIPTISRCVTALRERGYDIKSLKEAKGWRYILAKKPAGRLRPLALPFAEANRLSMRCPSAQSRS
jgi:biotin operon repressor